MIFTKIAQFSPYHIASVYQDYSAWATREDYHDHLTLTDISLYSKHSGLELTVKLEHWAVAVM